MFTGLVEEKGRIIHLKTFNETAHITIAATTVTEDLRIGDSVAVNGPCLTAVSVSPTQFTAVVMAETLNRTTLGSLQPGALVNLERALRLGGRLGGHLVLGHIDGVGTVNSIVPEGSATRLAIAAEESVHRYIVPKGSVAIDGVSLTIAKVECNQFWVAIIPHTQSETTLPQLRLGDRVNLETDIIGKYVVHSLQGQPVEQKKIGVDFLRQHGFA